MANVTASNFDLSDLNAATAKVMLPNTIILVIYIIIGCLSNFIVLLVYTWKMRDTLTERFFIPVLATIDFVTIVITTGFNLTLNTLSVVYPGSATCKSLIYLSYLTTITSMGVLLLIAVQRYQKVCQPLKPQMTLFWKKTSVGIVVLAVALFHIPVLFFYGVIPIPNKKFNLTTFRCSKLPGSVEFDKGVSAFQGLGVFVTMGAMLCVIVLYGLIGKVIFTKIKSPRDSKMSMKSLTEKPRIDDTEASTTSETQSTTLKSDTLGGNRSSTMEHPSAVSAVNGKKGSPKKHKKGKEDSRTKLAKYRFTFMFMAISFLALVTNIPPWTFIIMESQDPSFWRRFSGWKLQVALFLRRIYIVDHVFNPIIYGLFDLRFRAELKKLFCRCRK